MSVIRRMKTTISASFESLLNQVENHEALANTAIREMSEAAIKAKAKLRRMQMDSERLKKKIQDLESQKIKWTQRAKETHESEEKTALECVKRIRKIDLDLEAYRNQFNEHTQVQLQLSEDLKQVGDRLDALKRKRNVLATRESRAQALKAIHSEENNLISEIDCLFDRWEDRINEHEVTSSVYSECNEDELENRFSSEEEQEELRSLLNEIVVTKDNKEN